MLRRIRDRHQTVVAYIALFVAMGGTAIAAKPLITGSDVAPDTLTGANIQESTLIGVDADKLDGKDSSEFGLPTRGSTVSTGSGSTVLSSAANGGSDLFGVLVQAGRYAFFANVPIDNLSETVGALATCSLRTGAAEVAKATISLQKGERGWLPLMGIHDSDQFGAVTLHCQADVGSSSYDGEGKITRIRLDG
jgi:hypothetical protein